VKLAVIGLGLIGGSLARALRTGRATGLVISGFDTDPKQMRVAVDLGVVDQAPNSAQAAVSGADIVVIAVPVLHTGEAMSTILPAVGPTTVVTDVGSTKQSVLADIAKACGGKLPPWFVAGHPIAGTEKSGVANSFAELFHGHRVILTPHPGQSADARDRVKKMWKAAGARVVEMDPARHDEIFAATSHLPHLLAYGFVDMLTRLPDHEEIFRNAGGGFRDFTRIASSSPQMWHDIVRANRGIVSQLLERQIADLTEMLAMVQSQRWDDLKARFERARAARERHLTQIE
jgi:prephenate dehydrogenase